MSTQHNRFTKRFCNQCKIAKMHPSSPIGLSSPTTEQKIGHPHRCQLPPAEAGSVIKRIFHTVVYEQKWPNEA